MQWCTRCHTRLQYGANDIESKSPLEAAAKHGAALNQLLRPQHSLSKIVGRLKVGVVQIRRQLVKVIHNVAGTFAKLAGLRPPSFHLRRQLPDLIPQHSAFRLTHRQNILAAATVDIQLLLVER